MKVLVTGGSGFIGQSLKKIKPDWIYISSKDYDLTDPYHVRGAIRDHRHLDAIVHLAGKVGGIKDNATKQAEYMYQNLMINELHLLEFSLKLSQHFFHLYQSSHSFYHPQICKV